MIELIATGTIEQIEDNRINRDDGHDSIYGRVSTIETIEVDIDLEFAQGHVNLEGYSPSAYDRPIQECIGRFFYDQIDRPQQDIRFVENTWEIKLQGENYDWIQQAHRYVTERPDMSIREALAYFKQWSETKTETIETAIEVVENQVEHATTEVGELSDTEWMELEESLNGLLNVSIPVSYANE